MRHVQLALTALLVAAAAPAAAGPATLDVEGECGAIAEADATGCGCQGRYFASRFGPEDGAAALHLVTRSYVSEPRSAASVLYERFSAETLNRVASRILDTRDDVAAYCPTSAHVAD